jgi:hypothetical protein
MIRKLLFIFLVSLISCRKVPPQQKINSFYKEVVTADDRKIITPEEAKTYHVDTEREYKYRTGNSGHYEYNYDVKGINCKGDSVFGNINVQGKCGAGIITNSNNETVDIKTEWVGYGKLRATDKINNEYNLIVD